MNFSTQWLRTRWHHPHFLRWPASNEAATCQISCSFWHLSHATYSQRRECGDSLEFHHCFWPWLEPPMNKIDGNSVKVRMKLNSKNAKCLDWTARAKPSLTVRTVKQKQTSLIFTPMSQRTAVALTLWRE